MFLHLLNDRQKGLFMRLAIKAAEVNGVVELEEKNMLKAYSIEMGIDAFYSTDVNTMDIINELVSISDEKARKIIVFEILGILICDSKFDSVEREFIEKIVKNFKINEIDKQEMLNELYKYRSTYERISELVLG